MRGQESPASPRHGRRGGGVNISSRGRDFIALFAFVTSMVYRSAARGQESRVEWEFVPDAAHLENRRLREDRVTISCKTRQWEGLLPFVVVLSVRNKFAQVIGDTGDGFSRGGIDCWGDRVVV